MSALAGIVLFYVLLESLGVTCPIRFLTGISCAGCGMSRAWLSLLRLDLAGALYYHPLFWLPWVSVYAACCLSSFISSAWACPGTSSSSPPARGLSGGCSPASRAVWDKI